MKTELDDFCNCFTDEINVMIYFQLNWLHLKCTL